MICRKSADARNHRQLLVEMFEILRKYGMKLNPHKCAFGVSLGKFLVYLVNSRGIESIPRKNKGHH